MKRNVFLHRLRYNLHQPSKTFVTSINLLQNTRTQLHQVFPWQVRNFFNEKLESWFKGEEFKVLQSPFKGFLSIIIVGGLWETLPLSYFFKHLFFFFFISYFLLFFSIFFLFFFLSLFLLFLSPPFFFFNFSLVLLSTMSLAFVMLSFLHLSSIYNNPWGFDQ